MALQKLSVFRNSFEESSRPQIRTIIRWINSGEIYGRKIGGNYYVDPNISLIKNTCEKNTLSNEAMELIKQAQA